MVYLTLTERDSNVGNTVQQRCTVWSLRVHYVSPISNNTRRQSPRLSFAQYLYYIPLTIDQLIGGWMKGNKKFNNNK